MSFITWSIRAPATDPGPLRTVRAHCDTIPPMQIAIVGLAGSGTVPLILGDLKPDYVDTVRALGGQIIRLGRGLGSLNVLDVGAIDEAAAQLAAAGLDQEATALHEEAHGRRCTMVEALLTLEIGGAHA